MNAKNVEASQGQLSSTPVFSKKILLLSPVLGIGALFVTARTLRLKNIKNYKPIACAVGGMTAAAIVFTLRQAPSSRKNSSPTPFLDQEFFDQFNQSGSVSDAQKENLKEIKEFQCAWFEKLNDGPLISFLKLLPNLEKLNLHDPWIISKFRTCPNLFDDFIKELFSRPSPPKIAFAREDLILLLINSSIKLPEVLNQNRKNCLSSIEMLSFSIQSEVSHKAMVKKFQTSLKYLQLKFLDLSLCRTIDLFDDETTALLLKIPSLALPESGEWVVSISGKLSGACSSPLLKEELNYLSLCEKFPEPINFPYAAAALLKQAPKLRFLKLTEVAATIRDESAFNSLLSTLQNRKDLHFELSNLQHYSVASRDSPKYQLISCDSSPLPLHERITPELCALYQSRNKGIESIALRCYKLSFETVDNIKEFINNKEILLDSWRGIDPEFFQSTLTTLHPPSICCGSSMNFKCFTPILEILEGNGYEIKARDHKGKIVSPAETEIEKWKALDWTFLKTKAEKAGLEYDVKNFKGFSYRLIFVKK